MTQASLHLTVLDADEERRRALAKIYSLLIKLAEKAQDTKTATETLLPEEKSVPLKENTPPPDV